MLVFVLYNWVDFIYLCFLSTAAAADAVMIAAPALVEELVHTPVKECFAGSVHTCVLTRLGQVYSFGKFEYTGHGRMGEDVLVWFR